LPTAKRIFGKLSTLVKDECKCDLAIYMPSSARLFFYIDLRNSRFLNRISNAHQVEEPTQFYGGILADPMGLGKTLTMIALVATDLDGYKYPGLNMDRNEEGRLEVPATLIIIPPSRTSYSYSNRLCEAVIWLTC
jgi:SNF2 family DNA or RNA helicase